MIIGFVLDDRLDKPDGVQQYVTLLGRWLSSQGHEVHYLVGHSPQAAQDNVHHLSKTFNVSFNKNRMAIPLPADRKNIGNVLKNHSFDVLHVQMPYSPLLAGRVVKAASVKTAVVGTFHILPHGALSAQGTRLLGSLLRNSKRRFQGFLSVSEAAKEFAASHFGITSTVLPNVVDLSKYNQGKPLKHLADRQNIVFLGRFVQRKGAHHLLDAYDLVLRNEPRLIETTRLVLCGDGPEREKLELKAASMRQYGANIVFTGFLNEEEKKDYLASATIAVFPSTGGESFGIVLIEGMAAGAGVVLGGDNPGYRTVLGGQPDSLITPNNHTEFASRMGKLLQDEQLRQSIHTQQQELVKSFDVKAVGPRLIAFYNESLAGIRK